MTSDKHNGPEHKVRIGGITATIWKNDAKGSKFEKEFYTVNLDKSYKDKEGKWQNSGSLTTNDMPKAILAMQKAYEYCMLKDDEKNEE